MQYRAGVVQSKQFNAREYIPVVAVQQGKRQMLVSSSAVRGFFAARLAAGELYRKLAGKRLAEKMTNSPKAGQALRAVV